MLQQVIECKQPADFVIIEDTIAVSGESLFSAFLKNHLRTDVKGSVHILCLQNPPHIYSDSNKHVMYYDLFTDPRNWIESDGNDINLHENLSFEQLFAEKSINPKEETVFIDSLSKLIFVLGSTNTYRQLHYLKKNYKRTVCLLRQEELETVDVVDLLRYNASMHIILKEYVDRVSNNKDILNEFIIKICLKKSGGKVVVQEEVTTIDSNYSVKSKVQEERKAVHVVNTEPEIENLTTFKLSLKSSEKEARSQVVLPYLKKPTPGTDIKNDVGGRIIYQPDAADDYDDEDPDDDLDV